MTFWHFYLIGALVTQVLWPISEWRRGTHWAEALWFIVVWPVGLMWPLCLPGIVCDIIDGPYRPKHKVWWS